MIALRVAVALKLGFTSVKFEAESVALALPLLATAVALEETLVELVKTAEDENAGVDALEEGAGIA